MLHDDLWLRPEEVCKRSGNYLQGSRLSLEYSIRDIALFVFDVQEPNRSASTQIGIALTSLGWVRRERRTKRPRYIYGRP